MAQMKVTITISPDGASWDVTQSPGGRACQSALQPLVDALGGEQDFQPKPEYFQEPEPLGVAMEVTQTEQASI